MFYVADTHAFVWYITGKLPPSIDAIFKKTENGEGVIYIPAIVLAEVLYLVKHSRIKLDFLDLLRRIEASRNLVEVPFNLEILKTMVELRIPELHDLIIVATAKILNAQLITKDKKIRESKLVSCIWA